MLRCGGGRPVEHVARRILDDRLGYIRPSSHYCRCRGAGVLVGAFDACGEALVDELVRLVDSLAGG